MPFPVGCVYFSFTLIITVAAFSTAKEENHTTASYLSWLKFLNRDCTNCFGLVLSLSCSSLMFNLVRCFRSQSNNAWTPTVSAFKFSLQVVLLASCFILHLELQGTANPSLNPPDFLQTLFHMHGAPPRSSFFLYLFHQRVSSRLKQIRKERDSPTHSHTKIDRSKKMRGSVTELSWHSSLESI